MCTSDTLTLIHSKEFSRVEPISKMPSQVPSSSASKRKASHDEGPSTTQCSPASKKAKTATDTGTENHDDRHSINKPKKNKAPSATAAALSSIPKAKLPPVQQAPLPAKRQRRSPPPKANDAPSQIPRSPSRSPPRQRKRPGQAARGGTGDAAAMRKRQAEREQQRAALNPAVQSANNVDLVRKAYNAVPERGRDWRVQSSSIKGLRSFNNWVKSAVIQKFSPGLDTAPGSMQNGYMSRDGLRVLDIGCGKGGDLQKWQNAPCQVDLYIGLDPADVSVRQARSRYDGMPQKARGRPLFNANFFAKDCFTDWVGDVQAIRQVGIDPNPGQGMSMPGSGGGFDVVSMMFSLHYSFEDEHRARGMLRNVAGALKKGGRFLGVMPNSEIIQTRLKEQWKKRQREAEGREETPKPTPPEDGEIDEEAPDADAWDPEHALDILPTEIDDTDSSLSPPQRNGHGTPSGFSPRQTGTPLSASSCNLADPQKPPSEAIWGNNIYRISFPAPPAAPHALFRPHPFGWKYYFFLEEAIDTVPEYVVPWEAFRALAADFDLELLYCKPFDRVWEEEREDPVLGPLSERMGVRGRDGEMLVGAEEVEAAGFYLAFCFYKS